jgi:hypothetical protein
MAKLEEKANHYVKKHQAMNLDSVANLKLGSAQWGAPYFQDKGAGVQRFLVIRPDPKNPDARLVFVKQHAATMTPQDTYYQLPGHAPLNV